MISPTAATCRDEPLTPEHNLSRAIAGPTAATILIVDDEAPNRKLLEALLRPEGYRTLSVANGEDALALIAQGAPDLILLDVMLPGMDGYEVARRLKANAVTSHIPIIMVTAQTDRSARLAGLDAGAEDFLTKPVERTELWLRVRNLLRLKALGDFFQNYNAILERQVRERTDSLRASESRFRQMADNIRDVFFLIDANTHRMLYVSPAYEEIWQRSRESLYENPESWTEAFHPDDRTSACEKYKQGLLTGTFEFEYRIVRPDAAVRGMEMRGFPVHDDAGATVRIACVVKDITQRKAADDKIRRLNRVYAVLSGINTLIVRVHDRDELLREACQIAVEHGNFGLACISELDPVTLDVTPVAWGGIDPSDQIASSKSTARGDVSRGHGVVGRAVRERKPAVCNDLEGEPDVGSAKRKEAIRRGYRSAVALPLIVEEIVWGTLTLYAGEVDFFNVDELRLLTELAGDIAFALENIRRQQKLDKLSRVRAVSSEINAAIVRIPERKALLQEVCRIVSQHGKFEMIWIGEIDQDKQQVRPVVWTGFTDETAQAVNWNTLSTSKGTVGDAIQSRKVGSSRVDLQACKLEYSIVSPK